MNFDIWFSERAEGLKWRALTEKYLKQPLKLNNILRTKILRGKLWEEKKGRNYISRQACFVNRFTLQGFNERIFIKFWNGTPYSLMENLLWFKLN